MNDEGTNDRLRKANPWKQRIDIRPDNPGRDITNNLPALEIEPAALDASSEIDPLPELPGAMAGKLTLVAKLEVPKWRKRGKIVDYGFGAGNTLALVDGKLELEVPSGDESHLYVGLYTKVEDYPQWCMDQLQSVLPNPDQPPPEAS